MSTPPARSEAMSEEYASAQHRYKPEKTRLLLIAESPPASGGYFYFDKTIGKDHLFRETMKTLWIWPLGRPMRSGLDKRPLLERFRSMNIFLIDTCKFPVDKLPPGIRNKTIREQARHLAGRVRELNPGQIVIVKKTIFKPVKDALEREGLGDRILNSGPIPFPSHGYQRKYRAMLRRLLRTSGLLTQANRVQF